MAKRELKPIEKYSVNELIAGMQQLHKEAGKTDDALSATTDTVEKLKDELPGLTKEIDKLDNVLTKLYKKSGKQKGNFSDIEKANAKEILKYFEQIADGEKKLYKFAKANSSGRTKWFREEAEALEYAKQAYLDYEKVMSKPNASDRKKREAKSQVLLSANAYEAMLSDISKSQLKAEKELYKVVTDFRNEIEHSTSVSFKAAYKDLSIDAFKELFGIMKELKSTQIPKDVFAFFSGKPFIAAEKTTKNFAKNITNALNTLKDFEVNSNLKNLKDDAQTLNDYLYDIEKRAKELKKSYDKNGVTTESKQSLLNIYPELEFYAKNLKKGASKDVLHLLADIKDYTNVDFSVDELNEALQKYTIPSFDLASVSMIKISNNFKNTAGRVKELKTELVELNKQLMAGNVSNKDKSLLLGYSRYLLDNGEKLDDTITRNIISIFDNLKINVNDYFPEIKIPEKVLDVGEMMKQFSADATKLFDTSSQTAMTKQINAWFQAGINAIQDGSSTYEKEIETFTEKVSNYKNELTALLLDYTEKSKVKFGEENFSNVDGLAKFFTDIAEGIYTIESAAIAFENLNLIYDSNIDKLLEMQRVFDNIYAEESFQYPERLGVSWAEDEIKSLDAIAERLKYLYTLRKDIDFEQKYGNEIVALMDVAIGAGYDSFIDEEGNKHLSENIRKYFNNVKRFIEARKLLEEYSEQNNTKQTPTLIPDKTNVKELQQEYLELFEIQRQINDLREKYPREDVEWFEGYPVDKNDFIYKGSLASILKKFFKNKEVKEILDDARYNLEYLDDIFKNYEAAYSAQYFGEDFNNSSFEKQLAFFENIAKGGKIGKNNFKQLSDMDIFNTGHIVAELLDGSTKKLSSYNIDLNDTFGIYEQNFKGNIKSLKFVMDTSVDDLHYSVESSIADIGNVIGRAFDKIQPIVNEKLLNLFNQDIGLKIFDNVSENYEWAHPFHSNIEGMDYYGLIEQAKNSWKQTEEFKKYYDKYSSLINEIYDWDEKNVKRDAFKLNPILINIDNIERSISVMEKYIISLQELMSNSFYNILTLEEMTNITDDIRYLNDVLEKTKELQAIEQKNNTVYHAGVISKLNKAETIGRFSGSNRGTGYYGTGHYFVDNATKSEIMSGNYKELPFTSVDMSYYDNLFVANTNKLANDLHEFLHNLTRYTQGEDKYSSDELYDEFTKVFTNIQLSQKDFENKLKELTSIMSHSDYFDRGDSVSTIFMKSLGYGGVDTRGTQYADTRYGTVIYDLKEESILQANITDELKKQGDMLEKISYQKGAVWDKSEDERIQSIIDSQNIKKAIDNETNKLFDKNNLQKYENALSSVINKIKEYNNIINNCTISIEEAEQEQRRFAKEMESMGLPKMSEEEILQKVNEHKVSYQQRIDELKNEIAILEKDYIPLLEKRSELEQKLLYIAREQAKKNLGYDYNESVLQTNVKNLENEIKTINSSLRTLNQINKRYNVSNSPIISGASFSSIPNYIPQGYQFDNIDDFIDDAFIEEILEEDLKKISTDTEQLIEKTKELTQAEIEATEKAKDFGRVFGISNQNALKEISDVILAYKQTPTIDLNTDENGYLIADDYDDEFALFEESAMSAGKTIEDVIDVVSKHLKISKKDVIDYAESWKQVRNYVSNSKILISDKDKADMGNDAASILSTIGRGNIVQKDGIDITKLLEVMNEDLGTTFTSLTTTQDAYRELYEFLKYKPLKVNIEGLPDSIREVVGQLLDGTYHGQGKYKVSSPKISSAKFSNQDVIDSINKEADTALISAKKIEEAEERKEIAYQKKAEAANIAADIVESSNQRERNTTNGNWMDDEYAYAIKSESSDNKVSTTYQVGEATGRTVEIGSKRDRRGVWHDFTKYLTDMTKVESEAIKITNKLTLAQADLNEELRKSTRDENVINSIQEQVNRYQFLLGLIDEHARNLTSEHGSPFSYDDYRYRVEKETDTYQVEIAAKTAKQIRLENENLLKAEGKIEQMRSKYRKNASKIDDVFKNTTEYKELEKVINSFSKLEDISKVEKAFNNIENVIATFKRNAKGLETLDTVKSALNQKSSLGDEVKQYELKLLSLGYTADEIKDKLSDLYTTAKTIQDISLTDADADNNNVVKFGEELKRFYQLKNQLESNIKLETEQGKRTTNLYRELTKLENERYNIRQKLIKLNVEGKSDEVLLNRLRQINQEMLFLTELKVDLEKLGVTNFHGEDIEFSNLREAHNIQLKENERNALIDKEQKSVKKLNSIYDELNRKRAKQYEIEKRLNTLSSKDELKDKEDLKNILREINDLLEERNKLSQYDNTGRRESYETYDLNLQKQLLLDIIQAYRDVSAELRFLEAQAATPGITASYDGSIKQKQIEVDKLRESAENAVDSMKKLSAEGKASWQEKENAQNMYQSGAANSKTQAKADNAEQSNKNKQAVLDEKEALDLLKKSLNDVIKAYTQFASSSKHGADSLIFKANAKSLNDAIVKAEEYANIAKEFGVSDAKISILQNDAFSSFSSSVQTEGVTSITKYIEQIEKYEEKILSSGKASEDTIYKLQDLKQEFLNLAKADITTGEGLQKFIVALASLGKDLPNKLKLIEKETDLQWINDNISNLDKLSFKSDDVKSKLTELKALVAAYESAKASGDNQLIKEKEIELLNKAPGLINKIKQTASGKGNLIDESIGKVSNINDLNQALLEYAKNQKYTQALGTSLKSSNGEVTGTFIDQNGAVVKLTASMDQMKNAMKVVTTTQRGAVGLFGSFKSALHSATQSLAFYFSGTALIRKFFSEFRQGIDVLKKYDSALTNISYTMNMSKDSLQDLGSSAVEMAKDLSMSLENTMKIYQIYANMQTTAEEIAETARPTAILSNLSGVDSSTASDQIQGILNQFSMLKDAEVDVAETSMHVVDVLDKISANVAIDYAKGIGIISDAVTATGQAAYDAGMSYEQLAAVSAKVAERTREDGSSIGNAIKTILTRISKVGKMPGYADEVDNETLSQASASLNEIGIAVYNVDGSFRSIDIILGELAKKWDGLTDAQQANIAYNVAATRQSNKFRAILEAWTSATELATEATNTLGNAEANQEKYLESYNGKLQQISTQMDAFWLSLFNSDAISKVLDGIIELTKWFNNLAEAITPIGALLTGFSGILLGITAGKYIKGNNFGYLLKNFGRAKIVCSF